MRESPVASEKIAVDQASRRPQARFSTRASIGTAPAGTGLSRTWPRRPAARFPWPPPHDEPIGEIRTLWVRCCAELREALLPSPRPRFAGVSFRCRTSSSRRSASELRRGAARELALSLDRQDDDAAAAKRCRRPARRRSSAEHTRSSAGSTGRRPTGRCTGTRPHARRRRRRGSSRRLLAPRRHRLRGRPRHVDQHACQLELGTRASLAPLSAASSSARRTSADRARRANSSRRAASALRAGNSFIVSRFAISREPSPSSASLRTTDQADMRREPDSQQERLLPVERDSQAASSAGRSRGPRHR